MKSNSWSSSIVRMLVLIAGAIVILEAIHAISISVTWHFVTVDVGNSRNLPEIAAGLIVGSLALIPNRKNRVRRVQGPVPLRWPGINSMESIQHLMCLTNVTSRHVDIR